MTIVYKSTNIINNHAYVGKTTESLAKRKGKHISDMYRGGQCAFHAALRKYGECNFKWKILQTCNDGTIDMNIQEQYWISYFDTFNDGYNMTAGGLGKTGYVPTESSIEKHIKSLSKIMANGKTIAKNAASKRRTTLLLKDPNSFKIIGQKSGCTQKRNNKLYKRKPPNFKYTKILLFDSNGVIVDSFLHSQLNTLHDKYPIRMIQWCLDNKKPMYTNRVSKQEHLNFRGWYACYEDKQYCDINTYFKNIRSQKVHTYYERYIIIQIN